MKRRGRHKRLKEKFATYIAKAEGMEFKIMAIDAHQAEYIARNVLGAELIYREPRGPADIKQVFDALIDPGGLYRGPMSITRVEPRGA